MSDVKHIKEIMQLIESIQSNKEVIVEARHDNNFKQAVIGIKNLIKDSSISNVLGVAIDTVEKTFFRIIKQDGFKNLPSAWKLFLSDVAVTTLYSIVMEEIEESKEDTGINVGKLKQKIDKLKQKNSDLNDVFEGSISLMRYAELLYHYNGISYQKIKDANPYDRDISYSFKTTLSRLEDEFKEVSNQLIVIDDDDDDAELILDMGQYKWYLLDRESCDSEGMAMGHCGNTGSPKSGDQILSLRQIVEHGGQQYYRPSLTFIINDGILGEMKGRANNKPDKKYHPYIMGLLKLPMINGIRGGGYKPEANFDLADLTEKQRNELVEIKGEDFLERSSVFAIIGKEYKETGGIDIHELYDELMDTYGIHTTLLDTNKSGKLVIDVKEAIEDTGYKGYVFGDGYVDVDAPDVDDYDSYLEYLNEKDYDAVVAYIMNNYEDDVKEYIEDKYGDDEEEYGLTFVRNNMHDIIEYIDIDPIKEAVETALRHAYESGTLGQMYETMRKALTELSEEYSITIPDALYQLDEDNFLCIVEPDNFMAFIETFIDNEGDIKLDFDEPYYGFYEFDEEYFKNDALIDQLVEHEVFSRT